MAYILVIDGVNAYAVEIVITVTIILLFLTLYLILISVGMRVWNLLKIRRKQNKAELLNPVIWEYMEDAIGKPPLDQLLRNKSDFRVFEELISGLLEHISGLENERLRTLLMYPPLYEWRFRCLNSRWLNKRAEAYLYFSSVIWLEQRVINRLERDLYHPNALIVHGAATALMSNNSVVLRKHALIIISKRTGISRMALLEILYKFIQLNDEQMDEEAAALQEVSAMAAIPEKNRALIVRAIADMGYSTLTDHLYGMLDDKIARKSEGPLTPALLDALGELEYLPVCDLAVDHLLTSGSEEIRKSVAYVLGRKGNESEHLSVLLDLTRDPEFEVRIEALKALSKLGEAGMKLTKEMRGQGIL